MLKIVAMDGFRRMRFHLADPDLGTFDGWTDRFVGRHYSAETSNPGAYLNFFS